MNRMSMKFAIHYPPLLRSRFKEHAKRFRNKPKVYRRIGIEESSKALRKMSYEGVFQVTLQNSTENAMFEHRRAIRASSLRTNAKNDVHYFTSSVFAF